MPRLIDLSHVISEDMPVYPGFPKPRVSAFLTYDDSRSHYDDQAEFLVSRYDLCGSLGTYLDSPAHRHRGGTDVAGLSLAQTGALPGLVIEVDPAKDRAAKLDLPDEALTGRAVLFKTGFSDRFGSDDYFKDAPYLSGRTIDKLIRAKAALVGIDGPNVDNMTDPPRPAHTKLLAAGVLIVENLTNLAALPPTGFRFWALPLAIRGGASVSVRAAAELED